jgi:hypothetical protein
VDLEFRFKWFWESFRAEATVNPAAEEHRTCSAVVDQDWA